MAWLFLVACGGDQKKNSEFPDPIPADPVPEVPASSADAAAVDSAAPPGDASPGATAAKNDAVKSKSLGAISVGGGISEDSVTQALDAVSAGTDACHDAYRQKNPQGAGELAVTVILAKAGKIKNLTVKSKSLKDKTLSRCLTEAFRAATWPAPTGKKAKISFAWSIKAKA